MLHDLVPRRAGGLLERRSLVPPTPQYYFFMSATCCSRRRRATGMVQPVYLLPLSGCIVPCDTPARRVPRDASKGAILPLTRGRALAYATPHSLWTPVKRTCKPYAPCYQGNGAGGAMLNVRACSGRPALARRACRGWQPQGTRRRMKRRRAVKDDVQRSRRGVPGGSPPVFGSPTSGFPRQAGILKCRKEGLDAVSAALYRAGWCFPLRGRTRGDVPGRIYP